MLAVHCLQSRQVVPRGTRIVQPNAQTVLTLSKQLQTANENRFEQRAELLNLHDEVSELQKGIESLKLQLSIIPMYDYHEGSSPHVTLLSSF